MEKKDEILLEALRNHEDKWVALLEHEQKVVAGGDDASEVRQEAERKGYKNVILMWVPPFDSYYIPFL